MLRRIKLTGMRGLATIAVALVGFLTGCTKQPGEQPRNEPRIASRSNELENRKVNLHLTPEILASIPEDNLEQAVMDYVIEKIAGDYDKEGEVLASVPVGVRALYLTWIVEGEVNNGGFNQYYWNSSGRYASAAVEAFEFFSATKHAELMREANQVHSIEAAQMQKFKDRGSLEAFSESYNATKLGPLDNRFFGLKENLSALRIAKIRSSPELFSEQ